VSSFLNFKIGEETRISSMQVVPPKFIVWNTSPRKNYGEFLNFFGNVWVHLNIQNNFKFHFEIEAKTITKVVHYILIHHHEFSGIFSEFGS
jgi:hypothetical protein